MGRACSILGHKKNTYRALVRKSEGKRLLVRRKYRWGVNIKIDCNEIRME
jgi:hypothetical protein